MTLTDVNGSEVMFLDRVEFLPEILQRFVLTRGGVLARKIRRKRKLLMLESPRWSAEQMKDLSLYRMETAFLYDPQSRGNLFILWILHSRSFREFYCETSSGNFADCTAGRINRKGFFILREFHCRRYIKKICIYR